MSSYTPLFGLLIVRFERTDLRLICGLLSILGMLSLLQLFHLNRQAQLSEHTFVASSHAGSEASAYLASYILPFLTVPKPSLSEIIMYCGFFFVVAVVSTNTSVIQVNPVLYLLGWKVYTVEDTHGFKRLLISVQSVDLNSSIKCTRLSNDVLIRRS